MAHGREAISEFSFWRLACCFLLVPQSKSGVENQSIGFQRHGVENAMVLHSCLKARVHSCFQVQAMAYNLIASRQFHSLLILALNERATRQLASI